MKATKISSYKGTTVYLTDSYNIRVTRKTISKRAGCGLRKNTSVCDWYAIDSPEALVCAIYQMKRIYMAQVIADLNKPKMGRPRKAKA